MNIKRVLGWAYLYPLYITLSTGAVVKSAIIAAIISALFIVINFFEKKNVQFKEDDSFINTIKKRLGVEHVYVRLNSKKGKNGAAGFAIPILPAYVSIGSHDEIDRREIIIHELAHVHASVYWFQVSAFYCLMTFAMATWFFQSFWYGLMAGVSIVFYMMMQEALAFNITRKIAREQGFESRHFSINIIVKYLVLYSVWISFAFTIPGYISGLFSWAGPGIQAIVGVSVIIIGLLSMNKLLYYFSKWFNKVFKDSKNDKIYKSYKVNRL